MYKQETIEIINDNSEFEKEYEYEIKGDDEKYKLKIEIKSEEIIFTLVSFHSINDCSYSSKYNYNEIIKILNLKDDTNNEIINLLNYINNQIKENKYKIIEEKNVKNLFLIKMK